MLALKMSSFGWRFSIGAALALALAADVCAQNKAAGHLYEFIALTPASAASCVNERGVATGVSGSSAFLWRPGSGLALLAPLAGYTGSFGNDVERTGFV